MRMMTDREVWLKAMEIVECHGTLDGESAVATIMDILDNERQSKEWNEWLRVAAAVDVIAGATAQ